jgi:hypothetical protein
MVGGVLCTALHTNNGLKVTGSRPGRGGGLMGEDVEGMGKEWSIEDEAEARG